MVGSGKEGPAFEIDWDEGREGNVLGKCLWKRYGMEWDEMVIRRVGK